MTTRMNQEIFICHLRKTIDEIKKEKCLSQEEYVFMINPIAEPGKPLLAKDEVMRLVLLSEKNIGGRVLKEEKAAALLTSFCPFVPIWIHVSLVKCTETEIMFRLDCSLRLRKPSLLRNQELGHPPFKAIFD